MAKNVHVIGAPMDYGSDRRGVDMGPSAIRYADLAAELDAAGVDAVDTGDLLVPRAEEREPSDGRAKFLEEIEDVTARLADEVADTLADGAFPLVLGGDHAVAIGSLSGSARDTEIGALWLDAHGDFNTPATSPSGNVHGMPLAASSQTPSGRTLPASVKRTSRSSASGTSIPPSVKPSARAR
jgi:arginase